MKKDLVFAPILTLLAASLFFLKFTGIIAHIAISVVGAIVLIVYTVLTKKEWRIHALEIVMRVLYGIALITGIIAMNVTGIMALGIIHKISAVLFLAAIIVVLATKLASKKKT